MARTGLYAIRDRVANAIVGGGCNLFKHEAAAIRFFSDLAAIDQSPISRHPGDYELLLVGFLEDDGSYYGRATDAENERIVAPAVILTGSTWQAMRDKNASP